MDWLITPAIHLVMLVWLVGLTCAIIFLRVRLLHLQEDYQMMQYTLQRIDSKLDGLAQARQVEDLAAKVAEAMDVRRAARGPRGGKTVNIGGVAAAQDAYLGSRHVEGSPGSPGGSSE